MSELVSHHSNLLIDIRLDVLGCCLVDHSELTELLVVISDHLIEPEHFVAILFIKLVLASHVLRLSIRLYLHHGHRSHLLGHLLA